MFEYVIWGIAPNKTEEELLVANLEGKPITDKTLAEATKELLTNRHGCTNVRIQTINLQNDFNAAFIKAINI